MDDQPASASLAKAALRGEALRRRNALSPEFRAAASRVIADEVGHLLGQYLPDRVALYRPIGSECDTRQILDAARATGADIALPAIIDRTRIAFRAFRPGDQLVPGGFGTLSPGAGAAEVEPDLIVLPLVGFDETGARLGYGRGYYDGAVAGLSRRPVLIGIAFSEQQTTRIPTEPHDVRLDWIVTEKGVFDFRDRSTS
jgi:5-formyltetrahydrofolate cyclo-ligase